MKMDKQKIAFITCVNDERVYAEARLYLQQLVIPQGMRAELLPVRGAASMAAGYNAALRATDAAYKVYLHQDLFLTRKDFLLRMLDIFQADASIGLLGLAGSRCLPASGVWWGAAERYGTVYHSYEPESLERVDFGLVPEPYAEAAVVDGLLMATARDIPWREDLFDGWHFYDISQSMEFWRHGMRVVVPAQAEPWCVHACGEKDLGDDYWHYRDVFQAEYVDLHKGQQPLGGSNESGCLWNNLQK